MNSREADKRSSENFELGVAFELFSVFSELFTVVACHDRERE